MLCGVSAKMLLIGMWLPAMRLFRIPPHSRLNVLTGALLKGVHSTGKADSKKMGSGLQDGAGCQVFLNLSIKH